MKCDGSPLVLFSAFLWILRDEIEHPSPVKLLRQRIVNLHSTTKVASYGRRPNAQAFLAGEDNGILIVLIAVFRHETTRRIFSSFTGSITPRSVMMPRIRRAGVTSKAGL